MTLGMVVNVMVVVTEVRRCDNAGNKRHER